MRTLLTVALIAATGLTVAVIVLANDSDGVRTSAAKSVESINYGASKYLNPSTGGDSRYLSPSTGGDSRYLSPSTGGDSKYLNPSTGYPTSRLPQLERPFDNRTNGTRYDGGPEEGSANVTPAQPKVTQQQAFPGLAGQASASSGVEAKHEAATAAAIGHSRDETVTRGSKTDPHGPASLLP